MKKKKALTAVSVFSAAVLLAGCTGGEQSVYVDVTELSKDTLQSTIATSGLVESKNTSKVYSASELKIETVNVEVGDTVKKGDILASLNTESVNEQILQLQDEIDRNGVSVGYSITEAEEAYSKALKEYNDGENREITNAKNNLDSAKEALAKAQEKYDDALKIKNSDKDSQLRSAESALETAKMDLEYAEKSLADAKTNLDNPDLSSLEMLDEAVKAAEKVYDNAVKVNRYGFEEIDGDSQSDTSISITEAKKKLDEAQKKYDDAKEKLIKTLEDAVSLAEKNVTLCQKSVRNAENSISDVKSGNEVQLSEYEDAVSAAKKNLEIAENTYNYTVKSVENQLETLRINAEKARVLSGNSGYEFRMDQLKKKLDEALVEAPADGVVTAVYAVEGSYANGLLFVIEDMNKLKVTSAVKEFDIIGIEEGQDVIIKSGALGGDIEYDGVVTKVSPVTQKGPDGSTVENGSYGVEVSVSDEDTQLLIGMSAKLSIITEEKEDVFSVRYDMLAEDEDGNDIIYVAEKNGEEYTVKSVPVTIGLETESMVEVSGDGLTDGMLIIENTNKVSDGMTVKLRGQDKESEASESEG